MLDAKRRFTERLTNERSLFGEEYRPRGIVRNDCDHLDESLSSVHLTPNTTLARQDKQPFRLVCLLEFDVGPLREAECSRLPRTCGITRSVNPRAAKTSEGRQGVGVATPRREGFFVARSIDVHAQRAIGSEFHLGERFSVSNSPLDFDEPQALVRPMAGLVVE
jgi:hypothetical protein